MTMTTMKMKRRSPSVIVGGLVTK